MKKLLLVAFALVALASTALAQGGLKERPLRSLRSDYDQVGVVAHVKVKNAKLAAPGAHSLYLLQGEVVEPFKGKVKRGQRLNFYVALEDGVDVNRQLSDWIVFLEESSNTPDQKRGWFALENSTTPHTAKNVARMRSIKRSVKRR